MDNMIYILFISIFIPILFMALLVEKKARLPIIFVLIGMFVSVFSAQLTGLIYRLAQMSRYEVTVIAAPIVEELLKALPVLYYALVISDKRERLFTASMATGIGFAVLENMFYLLSSSNFTVLDAVIRAFGTGLMHGMCTLLVGVGIAFVRKRHKIFTAGTFALLSTAITYHGIYNMLIQSEYEVVGALLPIVTYIPFLIWRITRKKKKMPPDSDQGAPN